ncbi:methylglyoxal reductase (NADPH-dependent) gre2 [Aspergillus hancockii]|nr:methylglyoxal reductase (NADPH-dependent) gre2 [Aspergillus hancockii]
MAEIILVTEAGYHVRGTVRSDSTAARAKSHYPEYVDQLSFAIVPEISTPGAFDEADKGVTGVIHTASPSVLDAKDNKKDLLQPAIQGSLNVLEAVAKYGRTNWNPITYEAAAGTPNASVAYCASKALAERRLWDWVDTTKPNFTVATI